MTFFGRSPRDRIDMDPAGAAFMHPLPDQGERQVFPAVEVPPVDFGQVKERIRW